MYIRYVGTYVHSCCNILNKQKHQGYPLGIFSSNLIPRWLSESQRATLTPPLTAGLLKTLLHRKNHNFSKIFCLRQAKLVKNSRKNFAFSMQNNFKTFNFKKFSPAAPKLFHIFVLQLNIIGNHPKIRKNRFLAHGSDGPI